MLLVLELAHRLLCVVNVKCVTVPNCNQLDILSGSELGRSFKATWVLYAKEGAAFQQPAKTLTLSQAGARVL